MSVSYLDDFGIHASLKATVVKASLELGGKFEDHEIGTACLEIGRKVQAGESTGCAEG